MKKTLVIHPTDRSTDFLKIVYENHKTDWTILNDFVGEKKDLIDLIDKHDRIIMMGHGTPYGLLNTGSFLGNFGCYIIDDDFANVLREKETVSIWCYSDKFFEYHDIDGFHTDMIISEVSEASLVLDKTPLNKEQTLENMTRFSTAIRDCIDLEDDPYGMQKYVLEHYDGVDDVTKFNRGNIRVL